jgi:hypothetical protein
LQPQIPASQPRTTSRPTPPRRSPDRPRRTRRSTST